MIIKRKINENIEKNNEYLLKEVLYLHDEDLNSKNMPKNILSIFPSIILKIIVLNRDEIVIRI